MSDKAAFVSSVYSRYRRKPLTLTLGMGTETRYLIGLGAKL